MRGLLGGRASLASRRGRSADTGPVSTGRSDRREVLVREVDAAAYTESAVGLRNDGDGVAAPRGGEITVMKASPRGAPNE
jgi:hypothetical protein